MIHRPKWIVVIVGILVFWLTQTEWLKTIQLWQRAEGLLVNNRYLLRGSSRPNPNIKLIGLTTTSFKLDTLAPEEIAASPTLQLMQQPWPWDRRVYAAILEKLMDAGAKVVMFDFVFASERRATLCSAGALEKNKDRVVIGEMFADEEGSTENQKIDHPQRHGFCCPALNQWSAWSISGPTPDQVVRAVKSHTSIERESMLARFSGQPDPYHGYRR